MRSLTGALIVAVVVSVCVGLGVQATGGPAPASLSGAASVQTPRNHDGVVGTYRLVTAEVKNADGGWEPEPNNERVGYITYSDTGYMGVHVMPRHRTMFADDAQPTAEEVQAALRGYSAYYGPYSVHADEDDRFLIHHRAGNINPGGVSDAKRFYDVERDRLVLTPAPASGRKADATRRVVWERLPDVSLSAEARRFVGFRQLLYTDRYTARDGEVVSHGQRNEGRAGSYIIYTPTGHMMVHLMAAEGRAPYASATPTPEEALAAYRSFGGYFGRFTVHENADPPYVVHHQEGRPRPSEPTDAVRLYELSEDVLRLGARPRTEDGEATGGHLYWQVLPAR